LVLDKVLPLVPRILILHKEKEMQIPAGVERVVLMIRHSVAPKTGNDGNKTLTIDGKYLCQAVRDFYDGLVTDIGASLNVPMASYHCSTFPRSMMTAWEIFGVANIQAEETLKVWASLASVNGGEWMKAQMAAGKNEPAMIREFLSDPKLMTTGDFGNYRRNYVEFIEGQSGSDEAKKAKFVVAVCHEAGISLAASWHLPVEQVGLANCEAVLFYVTGGVIVGAEKIVPEKTVTRDTWPL
jgi:hypothetical protein